VIAFAETTPEFVLKVCETLFSRTSPHSREMLVLGGVHLYLYVNSHWAGFERYMLVGQGWTLGFNLREPVEESDPENIFTAFANQFEMFTPSLTGDREFMRDMTILMMSACDWDDEDHIS
jgi:hypothetical protein